MTKPSSGVCNLSEASSLRLPDRTPYTRSHHHVCPRGIRYSTLLQPHDVMLPSIVKSM